jgi:hypothetical protein
MTAVSIAATVASTAVGMISSMAQQKAQESAAKKSAQYQADVAAQQQAVDEQLARNEMSKGIADRERQQRDAARKMADMRAAMGASGFEMDSGTNLSLLAESASEHQYDSQVIMNNAAQAAYGHQVGAWNSSQNQALALYQKDQAGNDGGATGLGMAGTLLGGIATGIGQYNALSGTKTPQKNAALDALTLGYKALGVAGR